MVGKSFKTVHVSTYEVTDVFAHVYRKMMHVFFEGIKISRCNNDLDN